MKVAILSKDLEEKVKYKKFNPSYGSIGLEKRRKKYIKALNLGLVKSAEELAQLEPLMQDYQETFKYFEMRNLEQDLEQNLSENHDLLDLEHLQ